MTSEFYFCSTNHQTYNTMQPKQCIPSHSAGIEKKELIHQFNWFSTCDCCSRSGVCCWCSSWLSSFWRLSIFFSVSVSVLFFGFFHWFLFVPSSVMFCLVVSFWLIFFPQRNQVWLVLAIRQPLAQFVVGYWLNPEGKWKIEMEFCVGNSIVLFLRHARHCCSDYC